MTSPASRPRRNGGMMKIQPIAPGGKKPAMPKVSPDDKIIRSMPITEKQLGTIKKYYGIK